VPAIAAALGIPNVVIENVPGVVRDRNGVVSTAAALLRREGYEVEMGVLAADELGWPQTRNRFFMVASKWGTPRPLQQIREEFADDPRPISWALNRIPSSKIDPPWMANGAEMSAENIERMNWLIKNDKYDLPNHLRPKCHQQGTTYNANYGRMRWDRPAGTLTTGFATPGRGRFVHPLEPRTLTNREAARIQAIPDWFDFSGGKREPRVTDLRRWIGNAVPPILAHAAVSALPLSQVAVEKR
jgi:DNA (cytosine-5)-methyltransferase 1